MSKQYRIYSGGSIGLLLPNQVLTDSQVKRLRDLGSFDVHLAAGRIVDADLPGQAYDRSVIKQTAIKAVNPDRDPKAAYRTAGAAAEPEAPGALETDEVDELQEQLSEEPEGDPTAPDAEFDLSGLEDADLGD